MTSECSHAYWSTTGSHTARFCPNKGGKDCQSPSKGGPNRWTSQRGLDARDGPLVGQIPTEMGKATPCLLLPPQQLASAFLKSPAVFLWRPQCGCLPCSWGGGGAQGFGVIYFLQEAPCFMEATCRVSQRLEGLQRGEWNLPSWQEGAEQVQVGHHQSESRDSRIKRQWHAFVHVGKRAPVVRTPADHTWRLCGCRPRKAPESCRISAGPSRGSCRGHNPSGHSAQYGQSEGDVSADLIALGAASGWVQARCGQ